MALHKGCLETALIWTSTTPPNLDDIASYYNDYDVASAWVDKLVFHHDKQNHSLATDNHNEPIAAVYFYDDSTSVTIRLSKPIVAQFVTFKMIEAHQNNGFYFLHTGRYR